MLTRDLSVVIALTVVGCGGNQPGDAASPDSSAPLQDPSECVDQPGDTEPAWVTDHPEALEQMQAQLSSAESCRQGQESGELEFRMSLAPDGSVACPGIGRNDFEDCSLARCIEERLRGFQFQLEPGQPRWLRVPLQVRPGKPLVIAPPSSEQPTRDAVATCGEPETKTSGLEPTAISKTTMEHYGPLRECYEKRAAKNPELQGALTAVFTIDLDGSVTDLYFPQNELTDCSVVECIRDVYEELRFPKPNACPVRVSWTFAFVRRQR